MVVESGNTYDRSQIMQHFAHYHTDPKTNVRLSSTRVMTNRVVKLELKDVGLTGAVQACIGWFTSLRVLYLNNNKLTSVPAEIGQLTSLRKLNLTNHRLSILPRAIGVLAVNGCEVFLHH